MNYQYKVTRERHYGNTMAVLWKRSNPSEQWREVHHLETHSQLTFDQAKQALLSTVK